MQVIGISNFARDDVSDLVIQTGLSKEEAAAKAADLNAKYGAPTALRYYVVKADDYTPYVFEP